MGGALSNPLAADAATQQSLAHPVHMPADASQVHISARMFSSSLHLGAGHSLVLSLPKTPSSIHIFFLVCMHFM